MKYRDWCFVDNLEEDGDLKSYVKRTYNGSIAVPANKPLMFIDGIAGIVFNRSGNFQTQLFILSPNTNIPEHTHPTVDSYEVSLWGMEFYVSGKKYLSEKISKRPRVDGQSYSSGAAISIPEGTPHWGRSGSEGGAFMSFQKWKGDPSSIEQDWDGAFMGKEHETRIERR